MAIQRTSTANPTTSSNTTSPAPSTQPISFPAQTFAKLAPTPFLHAHLTSPSGAHRPSGRKPSECRPPTLHTGSLSHASGSAVVRIGDSAVVCGIRGEILTIKNVADWKHPHAVPESAIGTAVAEAEEGEIARRKRRKTEADEIARLNLLVPNVELSTGCSPAYIPGSPPSDLAQTLSYRVLSLLYTTQLINAEDVRIWHHPSSPSTPQGTSTAPNPNNPSTDTISEEDPDATETPKPQIKAYWTLHISILFLSLDGNPFDAAWCSLLAALQDVRLPRAWWDPDLESVLCSPERSEATSLSLNGLPIPLTVGVISQDRGEGVEGEDKGREKWLLMDMDGFEEGCVRETVCLVVKGEGDGAEIVRLEKSGGGMIGRQEISGLVEMAGRRWKEWKTLLAGKRGGEDIEMGD